MSRLRQTQNGSVILEAIIAILVFTVGIIGLIALQGTAISTTTDTRYRIEANQYANRILSAIQGNVSRTNDANFQASLNSFAHNATGGDAPAACTFAGTPSANAIVTNWLGDLAVAAATQLPNADAQIRVTWGAGTANQVRVVICWAQPGLPVPRRHVVIGSIS